MSIKPKMDVGEGQVVRGFKKIQLLPNARRVLDEIGTPAAPGPRKRKSLDENEQKAVALSLLADGYPVSHIGKILGVNSRRAHEIAADVRQMGADDVRVTTVEDYASSIQMKMETIYMRLMDEARTAPLPQHRILALDKAMKTLSELVRCLQQMGIVYKEPERLRIENEVRIRMVSMSKVFIAGMDKFLDGDAKAQFGKFIESEMVSLGLGEPE